MLPSMSLFPFLPFPLPTLLPLLPFISVLIYNITVRPNHPPHPNPPKPWPLYPQRRTMFWGLGIGSRWAVGWLLWGWVLLLGFLSEGSGGRKWRDEVEKECGGLIGSV